VQVAHTNVTGQAWGTDILRDIEILDFGGTRVTVG
jgi:hypothetical protein